MGVWVGNFSGEPMRQVSGVSGAAPIWLDLMNILHAHRPSRSPRLPTGVGLAQVSFHQDLEPTRPECFIKGTEPPPPVRPNLRHQKTRIIYPPPETLISLDPEIPEDRQRVPFRFQPASPGLEWVLNDRKTGVSEAFFLWKPERGSFILSVVDKENQILDSVAFQVPIDPNGLSAGTERKKSDPLSPIDLFGGRS